MASRPDDALPPVSFSQSGGVRYLHLGTEWVQGSMEVARPFDIELEYVQRMMVWLLFVPLENAPSLSARQAVQLGLGAGALTKFHHKRLRMRTTAVEINPQVLAACRSWFKLPPDDARLSVVMADAGHEIAQPRWHGQVDALQVDLYDHNAAAPVLDSAEFYRHCRAALSDEGVMTVNLFGRHASYEQSLSRIGAAFGRGDGTTEGAAAGAVWAMRPTREGNTIVVGLRQPASPARDLLAERARIIETRWALPATKWLRLIKPVS